MAQLDGMQRNGGTATIEQLLHYESPTTWNDPEDYQWQNGKKISVIAKVKEKAKKWRQNLAKKKFGYDGYSTPSWGVALEDYEVEEEPENNGFHGHDSQHVTKIPKDGTRQHHRLEPYITDKRLPSNNGEIQSNGQVRQKLPTLKMNRTGPVLGKSHSNHLKGNPPLTSINENPRALSLGSHSRESNFSPSKFNLDTLVAQRNSDKQKEKLPCSETTTKLGPSETHVIEEKEEHPGNQEGTTQVMIDESSASQEKKALVPPSAEKADEEGEEPHSSMISETEDSEIFYSTEEPEEPPPNTKKTISEAVSEKLAPAYSTVSEATYKITSKLQGLSITSSPSTGEERKWDKGVSVKEYFKNKLEPGEDERALSQVISEVISPRRSPTEKGVVEKVNAAVSMLLQTTEELEPSSSSSRRRSSSQIPISTNAYEVEEENQGRILQAN